MQFDIITIFPTLFDSFKHESLIKKAEHKKILSIHAHNIRDWTLDIHKTVDDKPYGGGPGMIFKIEPLVKTLQSIRRKKNSRIILLTPSGTQFTQKKARIFSKKYDQLILLCGRYEGFDARIKRYIDEEISIGPYVLNGGEVAAMVIIEAVARLIPGMVGNKASLTEESFQIKNTLEYAQYTRPEVFKHQRVPNILLSGDHKKIAEWRKKHQKKTKK